MLQLASELPQHRNIGSECTLPGAKLSADDGKSAGGQGRSRRSESDAFGYFPSGEDHRLRPGVVKLDELERVVIVRRMIHHLVEDDSAVQWDGG